MPSSAAQNKPPNDRRPSSDSEPEAERTLVSLVLAYVEIHSSLYEGAILPDRVRRRFACSGAASCCALEFISSV